MIELAYFDSLTLREIADQLGEPSESIKARMGAGLVGLRHMLAEPSIPVTGHKAPAGTSS